MKKLAFLILALPLMLCCLSRANAGEKSFPASEPYVKLTGRTQMRLGVRWLIHSASAVSFRFTGTKASVTLVGDASVSGPKAARARFAVYVNGRRVMDRLVDKREETIEIFSSDVPADTEISVVKLSEAAESVFGIRRFTLTADGSSGPVPLPDKALRIEFIGDSITCGYGVDDENRDHHFSTATEDATKSFAFKTAAALDADYSFVSYSGHGIVSGYTSNGVRTPALVPPVYEKYGKNYGSASGKADLDLPWDFSLFRPDIVVINLGTNDDSYTGDDARRQEEFTAAYAAFLGTVRKNNPGARIVCVLGVMGDRLFPCVEEAVRRYSASSGDTRVEALRLPPQDGSTGFAADWHPTEATQEIAARALTALLSAGR